MASGNDPQFRLRLPERLKEQISESAKSNHRSLNQEIVSRLLATFTSGVDQSSMAVTDKLHDLEQRLSKIEETFSAFRRL